MGAKASRRVGPDIEAPPPEPTIGWVDPPVIETPTKQQQSIQLLEAKPDAPPNENIVVAVKKEPTLPTTPSSPALRSSLWGVATKKVEQLLTLQRHTNQSVAIASPPSPLLSPKKAPCLFNPDDPEDVAAVAILQVFNHTLCS